MGVCGLTSFIDKNQHVLRDHLLHDCRLVIDGNNLYHFLYHYLGVQALYGGDYDTFADGCRYFFTSLAECQVTPYVVFDGAYHPDGSKLATVLNRAREKIDRAVCSSPGSRGRILPLLAYDTFRATLVSLRVAHATCVLEADQQIAALARRWCCPVLSNDSDFFIYDLPGGVILLDYLNLQVLTDVDAGYKYMAVQVYYLDSLLKAYGGARQEMAPLFAALMGNDVINGKLFDTFFARHHLQPQSQASRKASKKKVKKKYKPEPVGSKRQSKMPELLRWLAEQTGVAEVVAAVLEHVGHDRQNVVREAVLKCVENYSDVHESWLHAEFEAETKCENVGLCEEVIRVPDLKGVSNSDATAHYPICDNSLYNNSLLDNGVESNLSGNESESSSSDCLDVLEETKICSPCSAIGKSVNDFHKSRNVLPTSVAVNDSDFIGSMPGWFTSRIRCSDLPVVCLNVLLSRRVILQSQVEVLTSQSSHTCAIDLRRVLYGLLLSKQRHDNDTEVTVDEYDRDRKNLKRTSVVPVFQLDGDNVQSSIAATSSPSSKHVMLDCKSIVFMPSLEALVDLDVSHRLDLLMHHALHCHLDCPVGCPAEVWFIVAVLVFWATHADPKVSNIHVIALLACFLKLGFLDEWIVNRCETKSLDASAPQQSSLVQRDYSDQLKSCRTKLSEFSTLHRRDHSFAFDAEVVHVFAQFQSCLFAACHINHLLLQPVPSPNPARMFNGSFVHVFARELRLRRDPLLYVEELLGRGLPVVQEFRCVVEDVYRILPQGFISQNNVGKASANKKESRSNSGVKERNEVVDMDEITKICEELENMPRASVTKIKVKGSSKSKKKKRK